ncbi:hypothetical protein [Ignicoccus hospitalis]|uniref:Uncharacterized protein n=1 Tax=Ignicoccus hospitalis (strain KIN4/I / DSM 18386 / JCM 14125) TaxID=453591 RepID=A8A9L0_IGNH4|nr:hypothetical protein [Ignicoccus hospitalis]ABU81612.1 hypothetical protein Igni_0429 [Ignicoccus hospitalis KIN4/I]HIH90192.1 hypothetical protein [Desulfurococcaceae archaeon]
MKSLAVLVTLLLLALAFREGFFLALGVVAYLYLLFVVYQFVKYYGKALEAGRSAEHYSKEVVDELKALVKAIHLVKSKRC